VAENWLEFSGGLRGRRTRAPETPPFSFSGGVLVSASTNHQGAVNSNMADYMPVVAPERPDTVTSFRELR